MKMSGSFVWLCAVTALLGVVGCGADPDAAAQADGTELATAEQALWMTYHGGGGGWPYMSNGIDGYGGVDLYCDKYVMGLDLEMYDGFFRTRLSGGPYGSASGSHTGWKRCPTGQFLVGIGGAAANYLEQVYFFCGTPDGSKKSILWPWPQNYTVCGRMSTPGSGFTEYCPAGQIIRNLWIRSGSWMDGIQMNCGPHQPPYQIP